MSPNTLLACSGQLFPNYSTVQIEYLQTTSGLKPFIAWLSTGSRTVPEGLGKWKEYRHGHHGMGANYGRCPLKRMLDSIRWKDLMAVQVTRQALKKQHFGMKGGKPSRKTLSTWILVVISASQVFIDISINKFCTVY
jgi:hypothetical protein